MNNQDLRTLWVGDIEAWMNEKFIEDVFNKVGKVVSVKLIRQKETSLPAGYCFVEFQTHDQAERILMNYNQQLIPGTQNTFRMNWGKNPTNTGIVKPTNQANNGYMNNQYGQPMQQPMMQMPPIQEFSIYVGELELGVTEQQLAEHFRVKYGSVIGSKIITEPSSKMSKGYGFVKFSNSIEGQRAIHEMNGSLFKGKFIKVSQAVSRQQQQAAGTTGTPGYAPTAGYGTTAPDMYGYTNPYYPQTQTSYEQYYQQYQQQQQNGSTSTQYQQYGYPYNYSQQYYQNGYGTDPSSVYGQTAQTQAYTQQAATTAQQPASGYTQQQYQQYQQYAQQGQLPQGQTAASTQAHQQYAYGQTAQTQGQQGTAEQQYAQQMNQYNIQQQSANTNAQYGQYPQQVQAQTQQASQTQGQTSTSQHSNQQQYNQGDKKEDHNSIPTPSDKDHSFLQKPSCEFIGYQPDYVSMTGDLEFVLKHNIY